MGKRRQRAESAACYTVQFRPDRIIRPFKRGDEYAQPRKEN